MNTLPRAEVTGGAAAAQRDKQKQTAPAVLKPNNYGERCAHEYPSPWICMGAGPAVNNALAFVR
jgi:hypothetical protein